MPATHEELVKKASIAAKDSNVEEIERESTLFVCLSDLVHSPSHCPTSFHSRLSFFCVFCVTFRSSRDVEAVRPERRRGHQGARGRQVPAQAEGDPASGQETRAGQGSRQEQRRHHLLHRVRARLQRPRLSQVQVPPQPVGRASEHLGRFILHLNFYSFIVGSFIDFSNF